jgi:transposase
VERSHAPYAPELRAEAVRLVRESGRPLAHLAKELGVSEPTLRQ